MLGSERWPEPAWLSSGLRDWSPLSLPFFCPLPPTPPHELTCGRASPVWCGDSDQPPMETNKEESGQVLWGLLPGGAASPSSL